MHKYWGKKPSNDLNHLIEKYSMKGDILFDPFAGYGVFCCEAYLMSRNVVLNDLNPIANFLNCQLLEKNVDLQLLKKQWGDIKSEFQPFINLWYGIKQESRDIQLKSILRNKNNEIIKAKYEIANKRVSGEYIFSDKEKKDFLEFEEIQKINDWFPKEKLIPNSRISATSNMSISDLFTKRTLSCHAKLFALINKYSNGNELNLLKVAFTANLANCSKLVPPIKSRGDLSQGAWMTGFYIGETYIENNVLLYFENRLKKIIKGKKEYVDLLNTHQESLFDKVDKGNFIDLGSINNFRQFNNNTFGYLTLTNDAKEVALESNSIDYIFTDPPYGEAVPYFEQSIIWNSWLGLKPKYDEEIVISDSKARNKNYVNFEKDIDTAFSEIARILKPDKFFSLTYHSLSGMEWKAITNACVKNGFKLYDFKWLVQKTFTPRQLNKEKSIKGDVLITFKKSNEPCDPQYIEDVLLETLIIDSIKTDLKVSPLETNEIFLKIMEVIFSKRILISNLNILDILRTNFEFINNKWQIK